MTPVKPRDEIVNEAASWKGTPWAHMQAAKGAGVDCIGIVRGLYGFVYDTEIPLCDYYYGPSWFYPPVTHSLLTRALSTRLHEIPLGSVRSGDILTFDRYRHGLATHCGIMLENNKFIHVDSRKGAVISSYRLPWTARTMMCFSFYPPEV